MAFDFLGTADGSGDIGNGIASGGSSSFNFGTFLTTAIDDASKAFQVYQQGQNIADFNKGRAAQGLPPVTQQQYAAGGLGLGINLSQYLPLIFLFLGVFLLISLAHR